MRDARPVTGDDLADFLQRTVSCVAQSVLRQRAEPASGRVLIGFDPSAEPMRLGRDRHTTLRFRHIYEQSDRGRRSRGSRPAITAGYVADLLDEEGRLIVGYHWHPSGGRGVDFPHLHVGRQFSRPEFPSGIRGRADRLVRAHLPTGPILLPVVLRLAIAELGVEPIRPDWAMVLDSAEAALRESLADPA